MKADGVKLVFACVFPSRTPSRPTYKDASPDLIPTAIRRCHHCIQSIAVPWHRHRMRHIEQGGQKPALKHHNPLELPPLRLSASPVPPPVRVPSSLSARRKGSQWEILMHCQFTAQRGPQFPSHWGQSSLLGSRCPSPGGGGSGGRRGGRWLLGVAGG